MRPIMNTRMNELISNAVFAGVMTLGAMASALAQSTAAPPQRPGDNMQQGAPQGGPRNGPGGQKQEALTAAQLAKIKAILAPYKAASLTAADAKAIKHSLRDAGLRPGRELGDALRDAGFDPRRLEELAPRPDHPPRDGDAKGGGLSGGGQSSGKNGPASSNSPGGNAPQKPAW